METVRNTNMVVMISNIQLCDYLSIHWVAFLCNFLAWMVYMAVIGRHGTNF